MAEWVIETERENQWACAAASTVAADKIMTLLKKTKNIARAGLEVHELTVDSMADSAKHLRVFYLGIMWKIMVVNGLFNDFTNTSKDMCGG